jgi:glycosyl transferase family 11
MIIIKLDGGMGNQLFQYAIGKSLAHKLKAELKLDVALFTANNKRQYALGHFGIPENFSTEAEKKSFKRKEFMRRQLTRLGFRIKPYWYTERRPGYDEYVEQLTDNVYLEGFWQTEKYFKGIKDIIRREFVVKEPISAINSQYLEDIVSVNAVSVHVRRDDYVKDNATNAVHGVCDVDYYRKAIELMGRKIEQARFFIFSDDMAWTKANISADPFPTTYIEQNASAAYEDLRLMYSCKHHIIANSSFSWWGAWLNNAANKIVIAPTRWFRTLENKDIIPPEWITL